MITTTSPALAGFQGRLIGTQDADYDDARAVYNAMIDKRPGVISRPETLEDIAKAIAYARDQDAPLAIRGGGHNGAGLGTCDDGIDLDVLQPRQVDHDAAVAGPQPGAVVAAAPHRDEELVLAGEAERRRDVVRARDARDHAGALVDHRVVDGARVLLVGVLGAEQPPLESRERRARRGDHVSSWMDSSTLRGAAAAVMTRVDRLPRRPLPRISGSDGQI